MIRIWAIAGLMVCPWGASVGAVVTAPNELHFRISTARPDNVAAFYEARGFPPKAIQALGEACVLGVYIRNRGTRVIWLNLGRWHLTDENGLPVKRDDRASWIARLEALDVDQRHRATFGWTQLPETRDLHPDEPVAGNILITPTEARFRLEAEFPTGTDGRGEPLKVSVRDLSCRGGEGGRK